MQEIQSEPRVDDPVDIRVEGPKTDIPSTDIRQKSKPAGFASWIILALILIALIGAVVFIQAEYKRASAKVPELPATRPVVATDTPSPIELSNTFREIAKQVKPAVVFISVAETIGGSQGSPEMFGWPGVPRRRPGAGSGFIVAEDGYILTNNHVVENADRIEVTLSDNRKFKAKVIGTDPGTDLAVIKIDAAGLPTAMLGDSDAVQQGDWVLALGSPFGLQQTLTAGIVSATGRELGGAQFGRFIQTDASINPGNSGGPLVNMQGEVIGINSIIISPPGSTGGNIGIGFAIASKTAREVFSELTKNGKVTRGYLGVYPAELDGPTARALGLEPGAGVLISDVTDPNSPAAKAGLRRDDVITQFDGKAVRSPRELVDAVAAEPVGKTVRVDFIRNGQNQSVSVEIAERPAATTARTQPQEPNEENEAHSGKLGITGENVTPEMAESMKLQEASGVLVRSVRPGSPASEAGILHGDVIHKIDRTDVRSVDDLIQATTPLKSGDEVSLQVERRGRFLRVTVTIQ